MVNTSSVITYQTSAVPFVTNNSINQLQRLEQGLNTPHLEASQVRLVQFKQEQLDPPRLLTEATLGDNSVPLSSESDTRIGLHDTQIGSPAVNSTQSKKKKTEPRMLEEHEKQQIVEWDKFYYL